MAKSGRSPGNPLKQQIDAIRAANPELTTSGWLQELYAVPGIDAVAVSKHVGGRWVRKGAFRKGLEFFNGKLFDGNVPPDAPEAYLSRTFGDGQYDLTPLARGIVVAHFSVDVAFGISPIVPDAGNAGTVAEMDRESALDQIDGELLKAAKRANTISALAQLQTLNRQSAEDKGGEDMKPEELVQVVNALRPVAAPAPVADPRADRVYDLLLEMLKSERERNQSLLNAAPSPWASMLAPIVDLLKAKFTPAMIERLIARPLAEGVAVAPVSASLWSGIGEALAPMARELGPALALLISQRMVTAPSGAPAPAAPATAPVALPAKHAELTSAEDEAGLAESLDQIVLWVETEQYAEAWEALKLFPDDEVRLWVSQIRPQIRPEAYWLTLRRFHPRLGGDLRPKALSLIAHAQKEIAEALAAMQEDRQTEPGGDDVA